MIGDLLERGHLLRHAGPDGGLLVVGALDQRGAVEVALARALGRVGRDVVDMPVRLADPPAGHPLHEVVERHVDVQGAVDPLALFGQGTVEGLCLGARARKAVEDRAVGRPAAELVEEDPDDRVVRDQLPATHVAVCLEAERRPGSHGGPKEVARREDRHLEVLGEQRRLRPLPRSRGPQKDDHAHVDRGERGSSADEPFVVPHHELGFDLLHRFDHDGHHDEQARATEAERAEVRQGRRDHLWRDRDDGQEQGARERDAAHDPREVVLRRPAGADARDEPAVLAQLFGRLVRLERERGVEVGEPDDQQEVRGRNRAACSG